jgi:hypothetical protein
MCNIYVINKYVCNTNVYIYIGNSDYIYINKLHILHKSFFITYVNIILMYYADIYSYRQLIFHHHIPR